MPLILRNSLGFAGYKLAQMAEANSDLLELPSYDDAANDPPAYGSAPHIVEEVRLLLEFSANAAVIQPLSGNYDHYDISGALRSYGPITVSREVGSAGRQRGINPEAVSTSKKLFSFSKIPCTEEVRIVPQRRSSSSTAILRPVWGLMGRSWELRYQEKNKLALLAKTKTFSRSSNLSIDWSHDGVLLGEERVFRDSNGQMKNFMTIHSSAPAGLVDLVVTAWTARVWLENILTGGAAQHITKLTLVRLGLAKTK
jgi:hypothetical protein